MLAFFGATVGTAFGMTSSDSADKRTNGQHASQGPSTGASGDGQTAQQAATGDQSGSQSGDQSGDQSGQNGTNGTNGNGSGNQTGTTTTKVNVPWVTNKNESYARTTLKDAGLTAQVKYVCRDGVDPGVVTDQSPNGDTQANKGSKVSLKVQGIKVRDVVGTAHADAKSQLQGDGLQVVEKDAQPGDAGGAVSKQSPSAGSCVRPGSTVTITVGTTTDPSTPASPASGDTTNGQTTSGQSDPTP